LTEAAAGAGSGEPSGVAGDPLGRVVFAVLVVACFGAFFLTQRLKHTPTIIQSPKVLPYFSPYPGGHQPLEEISFKPADADEATVTIIDTNGDTVATLLNDLPVKRYKTVSLRWNGRRGKAHGYMLLSSPSGKTHSILPRITGPLAPPGEYRIRISLRHHGHPVNLPYSFTLVRG
jgi:hypothetical protein